MNRSGAPLAEPEPALRELPGPSGKHVDADVNRQRLARICALQRAQLARDWVMVHEALSPSRNIKRMAKPVSAGLLAMGGGLLIIWLLRKRTVGARRRLGYYLAKLAWLPRLWQSGRAADIYGLIRRFV